MATTTKPASTMTKGKCLCGKVELELKANFQESVACSCTSCQPCSGSPFGVQLIYPEGTVNVAKGKEYLTRYTEIADSGNEVHRYFCAHCGNGVYAETVDGTVFVKAPIVPGGLKTQPTTHIFTRNLPAWAEGVRTGTRFKAGPEMQSSQRCCTM